MKLLWLPGWYPCRTEPFNGDFVQRHARAVSIDHSLQVIFITRDPSGSVTRDVLMEETISGNLKEKIIYYYSPHYRIKLFDKIFSSKIYNRLYKQAVKNHFQRDGSPDLVNVHIVTKVGMIARWIWKKWRIPYVLSEQWTAYLEEARPNFRQWPFYLKSLWKKVVHDAKGFSVVSSYLGNAIRKIHPGLNFTVIPNVVDTNIFNPVPKVEDPFTSFIHISGMDHQKNPEDILKALAIVLKRNEMASLVMIGPPRPQLEVLAKDLGIEQNVIMKTEMVQEDLVHWVRAADALLLYSRYETFGCVIIEAMACGKPVILSDIPVMHENTREGVDAVFAKGEDPQALAGKMIWFMTYKSDFNNASIAQHISAKYNYGEVGKMFTKWYEQVLTGS